MSETSSSGPLRPPPPLCPLLAQDDDYDAWVLAGGRLFRAHTSVLASHSAYLRGAAVGAGGRGGGGDVRLLLPHVPPAGFAAILTYMYTGRLPVTPATLYEVLLAGHLLQMAGVVSLCQALLATTTSNTTTTSSMPSGNEATLGVSPELPPALSVWRGLARLVPPPHPAATSPALPTTIVRPTPTRARPLHHPLNPPLDLTREPEAMEAEAGGGEERSAAPHEQAAARTFGEAGHHAEEEGGGRLAGGAVVLDIATCDGPVFFERVINRAYKANPLLGPDDSETETEINVEEIDSCEDSSTRSHPLHGSGGDEDRKRLANLLHLPNTRDKPSHSPSPPMPNNTLSRTYHCVYCNHTFKSHYCYQKHMRRHINPITVEVDKPRPASTTTTTSPDSHQDGAAGERNNNCRPANTSSTSPYSSHTVSPVPSEGLKILDLNVQYFPCKTCGSKFPSYYFVHKHRRLCHQEEESSSYGKKVAPSTAPSDTSSTPTPTPTAAVTTTTAT